MMETVLKDYNLEIIVDENIRNFVTEALILHGTKAKLKTANKVANYIYRRFSYKGYINEAGQQKFVDLVIAAAFLHNLFFNRKEISTLFICRDKLMSLEYKHNVYADAAYIYRCIEAQIGEVHPIEKIKPLPNSPESELADAVYVVGDYKNIK